MRHVKRLHWLAAWGVWVWLGFGLHHQLPRELGPQVIALSTAMNGVKESKPIGFVGEHDLIACRVTDANGNRQVVLTNARTGSVTGNCKMPFLSASHFDWRRDAWSLASDDVLRDTLQFGTLLGEESNENDPFYGVYALDVLADKRRRLSTRPASRMSLHPTKPWVAIVDGERGSIPDRVIVADYRTAELLFELKLSISSPIQDRPFFITGTDSIVVPRFFRFENNSTNGRMEMQRWKIARPGVLEDSLHSASWPSHTSLLASSNGRLAFPGCFSSRSPDAEWFDVFDFNEGRNLSSAPTNERPTPSTAGNSRWTDSRPVGIAPSGRNVLTRGYAIPLPPPAVGKNKPWEGLHEAGTGRTLWQASAAETVVDSRADDSFLVHEVWHEFWKQWIPNFKFETATRRSLETGETMYRMPMSIRFDPRDVNADRSLVLLADGSVHTWPLEVNWILLAVCQGILATPLIFLWAILRWRRRRAARQRPIEVAA
jgi:hypothetical protein